MGYSSRGKRARQTFPDYFLSFGPFWTEQVELPIDEERIFHVGYPYLEMQADTYDGIDSTDSVVFVSQGSIGEQLSKFAVETSEYLGSKREVVYKLHPGEYDRWEDEYPWLVGSDITVIDQEEPSLYQLFAEASTQVGVYSTAVYEGLMFGLQTFLVDLPGIEYMRGLLSEPHIQILDRPSDIEKETDTPISFDTERYFRSDAIHNVGQALAEIQSNLDRDHRDTESHG
ncbi:hypothetical protein C474_19634 [Halogeometricum pallidum JCM 14848]|uniref:Capsule polysaccharide biosynthesis protein n=2 Tax=Halogeometricum TaxID=60846 RepID=M0CUT0_HALPD|nr:hypothetical protein C474_19634 [Halogeometricum pallidum JCM 14848]